MQHIFVWRVEDAIGVTFLGVLLLACLVAVVIHGCKLLWHKLTGKRKRGR